MYIFGTREETIATNHSVFPERTLKADLDRCLFEKIGHVANGLGRKKIRKRYFF